MCLFADILNVPTFHAGNNRGTDDNDLIASRLSLVSYSRYPKVDLGLEILCHNLSGLLPNISTFFPYPLLFATTHSTLSKIYNFL
jgi:hypothetical protein